MSLKPLQQQQRQLSPIESAAHRLAGLVQNHVVSQLLLQQPQPTATLDPRQHQLLASCADVLEEAAAALPETLDAAESSRALGLALRHKAALNAATLLAWVQQRPQQLQFRSLQGQVAAGRATALQATVGVWLKSIECLRQMVSALSRVPSTMQAGCRYSTLAAAMLQQLKQSGK